MSHEICDFVSTKCVVEIRDKGGVKKKKKKKGKKKKRMDRFTTTILCNQTNL
jgi:hypothetical protein